MCVTLQVTLIPSDQMQYMYPYERGHLLFRRARVDLLKPDYEVRSTPLLHLQIFANLKFVRILLSCALLGSTCGLTQPCMVTTALHQS